MGEVLKDESIDPAPESGRTGAATVSTMSLARLAAAGDRAATGQLLRTLAPRLYRVVRAVLGGTHPDLDDVLQQSLIGFVQALPAFRGECDPLGYATIIAVRTAVATRKRSHLEQNRRADPPDAESTAGPESSPGEEVARQRRKDLLRELLSDLPVEQGEALAMRVVLGWSLKEIADYGHVPLNTVRSRLRLAKEALRRKIEADINLLDALEVST
jgi:RNA polymerase sigma-70 factor (ECF subfamily)